MTLRHLHQRVVMEALNCVDGLSRRDQTYQHRRKGSTTAPSCDRVRCSGSWQDDWFSAAQKRQVSQPVSKPRCYKGVEFVEVFLRSTVYPADIMA